MSAELLLYGGAGGVGLSRGVGADFALYQRRQAGMAFQDTYMFVLYKLYGSFFN